MNDHTRSREVRHEGAGIPILLWALFGGTSAWTVHLVAGYSLASYACGEAYALWAIAVLTLIAASTATASTLTAAALMRRVLRTPEDERVPYERRDGFLASGGVVLGLLALMAIVFNGLAALIAGCQP